MVVQIPKGVCAIIKHSAVGCPRLVWCVYNLFKYGCDKKDSFVYYFFAMFSVLKEQALCILLFNVTYKALKRITFV